MANYTVYKNSDADAEIDTPNVAIRTERRESSFRILVTADDHTEVLVRRGEVEVYDSARRHARRAGPVHYHSGQRRRTRNTRSAKPRREMTWISGTPIATT